MFSLTYSHSQFYFRPSLCLFVSRTTPLFLSFFYYYYITSIVSRQISFNNLLMYATTIYVNKKCRTCAKLQFDVVKLCVGRQISRKFRRLHRDICSNGLFVFRTFYCICTFGFSIPHTHLKSMPDKYTDFKHAYRFGYRLSNIIFGTDGRHTVRCVFTC